MQQIRDRREKVAQCLRKGLRSPSAISKIIDVKLNIVNKDIKWLQQDSDVWLTNLAMGGYVHDIHNAVDALEALEVQLYALRDGKGIKEEKPYLYLKIVHMIQDSIALRVNLETKGPILVKLQLLKTKIAHADALALQVKQHQAN